MILRWLRSLMGRPRPPSNPLARTGEDIAARYLRTRGYRLLGRNVRLAFGEVDILAEDPDNRTIVVVEVKSRRPEPDRKTPPAEAAITAEKARQLFSLAAALRRLNGWHDRPVRIDVVTVTFTSGRRAELRHHTDLVRGEF